MTEKTTKEVLERLGFDKDEAERFGKGGISTSRITKSNHIVIDGRENVVYSGDEGARVYYFKGGSYCSTTSKDLKFPLTAPQLIEEYYNLKLALYIEKNEPSNFLKSDLKKEFHAKEILEAEQRLMSNRKMLNTLFPTTPESSTTNGRYLEWLNKKNEQPQQTEPEAKKSKTNKSLLFEGKELNLSERFKIANKVLDIDNKIRTLNIPDLEKYQLLAYILGCNKDNARNIMNGKYDTKDRDLTAYFDELNLKK